MAPEDISVFVSLVIAIVLEAAPFLLLGSALGALFEVYVSRDNLARYTPKTVTGGVFAGLAAGFVLPTCECGVVPIVLRMIRKGVPPHMAIAYMLAAPSVNPIVLASTYIAFGSNLWMVAGRVFLAVVPAVLIGFLMAGRRYDEIVRPGVQPDHGHDHEIGCDHGLEILSCAHCEHDHEETGTRSKFALVLTHTATDFLQMGKYLIVGATAAALFKFCTPYDILILLEKNVFLSVAAMMALAIILSVCSEADAFVAASFASFPAVAKLAFVGIGPMVDLKLIAMYGAAFRKRVVLALMIAPSLIIYGLSVLLGPFTGQ